MSAEVITLGCRLNQAESERLRTLLAGAEDLVVINSCAVTAEAVRQTRQTIRRARRARPEARLLVTGCAADIAGDEIAAMTQVDGLVPNRAKLDPAAWALQAGAAFAPAAARPGPQGRTRAFVAVQTGCDHACTFCIIPQGRGTSRSTPAAAVLRDVAAHCEAGAREVVLTGVDLTAWGLDLPGTLRLGDLVAAILDTFPQLPRLRLSSLDGVEIDPLLLELIASEPRVMPHLHLSLQHGADLILKRMRRRHGRADVVRLVAQLRQRRTEIAIGADLIAGFPTETDAHHAQNLSIIAELGVVHGHVFAYSARAGTPAARMPQCPPGLIRARAAELRAAIAATRKAWLAGLVGQRLEVLVESGGAGHSPAFAPVQLDPQIAPGTLVEHTPTRIEQGMLA